MGIPHDLNLRSTDYFIRSRTLRAVWQRSVMIRAFVIAAILCCLASAAAWAGSAITRHMTPFESAPFEADPDVPCLSSALETGDLQTGPSTLILKAPPGCVVPWHSHTAEEQLIVVRGTVLAG